MKVIIQRVAQGCVKERKATDAHKEICEVYGVDCITEHMDQYWCKKFRSRDFLLKVKEEIISSIGRGLVVLVGISENDTQNDINYITKKILNIKFFEDENQKKWSKNVMDKQYEILCVSQFTLCYNLKGNRLDFHCAMNPSDALIFYENFIDILKKQYNPDMIRSGKFGAYCQVELINDGPVTINLESKTNNKTESEDCL